MNDIVSKIFEIIRIKDSSEYIESFSSLSNDKLIIKKYYINDKGVCFHLLGENYDYRIYVDYIDNGKFLLEIRKKLAEIYKTYGIHWKIDYIIDRYRIITVEEREKIFSCDEKKIKCDDLILNWKSTLDLLGEKLDLNSILYQIKNSITTYNKFDVKHLIIVRDKLIKPEDYGMSSSGKVVLLEDIDFVLCLTDYKGEIIRLKGLCIDVDTLCGKLTFNLNEILFDDKITHVYEFQDKFFLYDYSCKEKYFKNTIKNFNEILKAQIDIYLGNDTIDAKFQNEYKLDYFNMIKDDCKYIIEKTELEEKKFGIDDERRLY